MRATIYYFSATGNSLVIARQIANGIGDCDVQSMAAEPSKEPVGGPGTLIGFVFPVFFCGLPRLVKSFVERLNLIEGTYCFAFATYGGSAADALGMLEDVLKEKGSRLSYAAGARMPGNYIVKYQAYAPDVIQKLIRNAMYKASEAAKEITNNGLRPVQRSARLFSRMANRCMYKGIAEWDENFHATDLCTGCGLCAKVCPVSNISMENRRPSWQHHCERCVACIQWCPYEAIEYGKKTIGRRRYRNPAVKAEDIIQQTSAHSAAGDHNEARAHGSPGGP